MTAPRYDIWDYYDLVLDLDDIAGGTPVDPRLIDAWQQANWDHQAKLLEGDPQTPQEAAERTKAMVPTPAVGEEQGWTTFVRDSAGRLCKEGRDVKAMLKECANIMKGLIPVANAKGVEGTIPLRARLAEQVFVVERLIPLTPERTEPDATLEKAIHVMTAQGPRDALKRTDVCRKVELHATLKVLRAKPMIFSHDVLDEILFYAQDNGLGADRSQGMGCFTYSLTPKQPCPSSCKVCHPPKDEAKDAKK
jgi:hypothetical protein